MSTLFLHVGQAGNEIGSAFWTLAGKEKPPKQWLYDERGRARCVLVDTEPKVVRGVVNAIGADKIHPRCALVEQSGRGNNWAMGYHGVDAAPAAAAGGGGLSGSKDPVHRARNGIGEAALEALRWQWERCDWCTGLVLCHSVGGGTGSGLGSLLLQEVRDAYPKHYLTSAAMCPFAAGELPMGHYNASLALSFVQEFADAALLFDNTQLLRQLTAAAALQSHAASHSSKGPARLDMANLDAYVARGLAGLAFPTDGMSGKRPFDPGDLVSSICPMPSLKCLALHSAPAPPPPPPSTTATGGGGHNGGSAAAAAAGSASGTSGGALRPPPWDALVNEVANRVSRYDLHDRPVLSLASQVVARGVGTDPPDERSHGRLAQLLGPSPCTPFPIDWRLSASAATALPMSGAPRTLTLVSNRSSAGPMLEQILIRAKLQLLSRAYVHHFEQHGVDVDFISERAELLQRVVDDYEAARSAFAAAAAERSPRRASSGSSGSGGGGGSPSVS